MSLIADIDVELAGMIAGLERAALATTAADRAAEQIANYAAGRGFTGIARSVLGVRHGLRDLVIMIGTAGQQVTEAITPVARAPEQLSPEDTIATLTPLDEQLKSAIGGVNAAIGKTREVQTRTAQALNGGQPGPMLARLTAIANILTVVTQRGGTASTHLDVALAEARKTGSQDSAEGGSAPDRPPDPVPDQPVVRDSRGRIVPTGVQRLPSGRYPANFEYAGRAYGGPRWTTHLAEKYPDGVRFTADGFPDFAPYALATVTFEPQFDGNRRTDEGAANQKAGLTETPLSYTWHHHQDTQTMQLVPTDMHDAVRHAGGVSIMKGRT